jgi:predicted aspartyl protease
MKSARSPAERYGIRILVFLALSVSMVFPVLSMQVGQADDAAIAARLTQIDVVMNMFFRDAGGATAPETYNRAVENHNQWIKAENAALAAKLASLDAERVRLEGLKTEIDSLDKNLASKPDASEARALKEYNDRVEKRNALAAEYIKGVAEHKMKLAGYNAEVEQSDREDSLRRAELDFIESKLESAHRWFGLRKDEEFFQSLNQFFAELVERKRASRTSPAVEQALAKVRKVRQELGERAIRLEDKTARGLIVLPVEAPGGEILYLVLDTGATCVSMSMEMIRVLGLESGLGETVETILAGGIRSSGRAIQLPWLSTLGARTEKIEGIVHASVDAGIDGILGRSFLKHFALDIDDARTPRVVLRPRGK